MSRPMSAEAIARCKAGMRRHGALMPNGAERRIVAMTVRPAKGRVQFTTAAGDEPTGDELEALRLLRASLD